MTTRREIYTGLIAALVSVLVLVGSLVTAQNETRSILAQGNLPGPSSTVVPIQIILITPRPGEPTYTPTPSNTPIQALAACPQPAGWVAIIVQMGDTLESLAQTYRTTPQALQQANCLNSNTLSAGMRLFVPGTPPPTPIPCGPPPGWVYYIVQPGDTLYNLSQRYGVSVADLQTANCLGSSTHIRVGQKLFVPNVPPIFTATFTLEPSLTLTPEPSATPTSIPPSATPTISLPESTPTNTPLPLTSTPSHTPIPTDTPSPTATFTPQTPSATPTEWPTPTTPPSITPRPPTATP